MRNMDKVERKYPIFPILSGRNRKPCLSSLLLFAAVVVFSLLPTVNGFIFLVVQPVNSFSILPSLRHNHPGVLIASDMKRHKETFAETIQDLFSSL